MKEGGIMLPVILDLPRKAQALITENKVMERIERGENLQALIDEIAMDAPAHMNLDQKRAVVSLDEAVTNALRAELRSQLQPLMNLAEEASALTAS